MKHTVFVLILCVVASAADYRAGIGRIDITPDGPIWLSGYAARKKPSEGVMHRLWAKALAIEDSKGSRAVIVTTDVLGIPRHIADVVGARVQKQYNLERSRLLLNSSHTHTGPVIGSNLRIMYDFDEPNRRAVADYTEKFTNALVSVVGAALADLSPAVLSYGAGVT